MLTEDYVSFEIAKLLKEKGFEQHKCQHSYNSKGLFKWSDNLDPYEYSAPTLQMAMKWLREVHKILILVEYDYPVFSSDIYKMDEVDEYGSAKHMPPTFANCKYYEQACEAAIKYCLENLI